MDRLGNEVLTQSGLFENDMHRAGSTPVQHSANVPAAGMLKARGVHH